MDKAAKQPFGELLAAHEKDYRTLFGHVTLDLEKRPLRSRTCQPISDSCATQKAGPIPDSNRSFSNLDATS